jgi:hypothetical protein
VLSGTGGGPEFGDPVGIYQRIQLAVVHAWVFAIAAALLVESAPERFLAPSNHP